MENNTVIQYALLVMLNGSLAFLGTLLPTEDGSQFISLSKAVTVSIDNTGAPFCSGTHVPAGTLNLSNDNTLKVPISQVGYIVTFTSEDGHPIQSMYKEYLEYIAEQERISKLTS